MKREAAFLSDVHGNLPALEAVLADLSRRGITEVYFLGDVLGKGPAVGEVISLLRARCSGAVYGNWDKLVLHGKDVERFGASYYRERLSAEDRAYLLSLPESLEIDFCGRSVLMYHGRFSINCVVTPMFNNSRDNVEKALYRFGPHDITLMGDAHHPFMLTHQGRFLMNTRAVGNPCDRMPLASYLILRDENGVFSSEHVRVPYDLSRAVSIALHTPQLPMLETYINETVTAVYSRSYKPNTNTPQTNPWEELPLSVYHLQTGVLGLREPLDKLLHNQLRDHPAKSYLLFGITDGSGLENAPLAHDTRIIGVDINEDYLRACRKKLDALQNRPSLVKMDLSSSLRFAPRAEVVLANLVLEYIGVNTFARQIAAINTAGHKATPPQLIRFCLFVPFFYFDNVHCDPPCNMVYIKRKTSFFAGGKKQKPFFSDGSFYQVFKSRTPLDCRVCKKEGPSIQRPAAW